jgi:hypothetical protein
MVALGLRERAMEGPGGGLRGSRTPPPATSSIRPVLGGKR